MKPKDKYRMKKKIAAGIALLLAVELVLSLAAPFLGYGIYRAAKPRRECTICRNGIKS